MGSSLLNVLHTAEPAQRFLSLYLVFKEAQGISRGRVASEPFEGALPGGYNIHFILLVRMLIFVYSQVMSFNK